jgi:hypothetical protein
VRQNKLDGLILAERMPQGQAHCLPLQMDFSELKAINKEIYAYLTIF